jgi:para-aminobenzoate synthetase component 1
MNEPQFWMGGRLATGLIAVTNDPKDIDDGFWAVTTTFDGQFTGAKFAKVEERAWSEKYRPLQSNKWNSSHSKEEYCQLVENFRQEIADGNVYQVNACRVLTNESDEEISGLLAGFLKNNPARFAGYLNIPGLEIASASPETFLVRKGEMLISSPIKGTRKPGLTGRFPEKDESENIMIVDLMRNDLSRVCAEDSVHVSKLLAIHELPGLAHLISDVEGTLRDGVTWSEIFEATLPPGSVSGAPKSSAIKLIKKYEQVDRGPYCGAFGWIHGDRAELAVAIRTFWSDGSAIKFGTGAGITWNSSPIEEWEETELKASRLIAIANGDFQ